jgi:ribosome-binding factor A
VAARLQTRFTPALSFRRDEGVKKSIEISRLIDEAIAADRQAAASRAEPDTTGDAEDLDDDQSSNSR